MFDFNFEIPASVRITRKVTYRVLWIEEFKDPKQIGECDYEAKQIVLKNGLDKWTEFWTFFHELEHAISEEMGLRVTEKQVNGLEIGFAKAAELNGWNSKKVKPVSLTATRAKKKCRKKVRRR